jgi:hypothetical protein
MASSADQAALLFAYPWDVAFWAARLPEIDGEGAHRVGLGLYRAWMFGAALSWVEHTVEAKQKGDPNGRSVNVSIRSFEYRIKMRRRATARR